MGRQTAREEEEGSLKGAKQQVERLMTGGNKNRNKEKSTNFSQPSAIAHPAPSTLDLSVQYLLLATTITVMPVGTLHWHTVWPAGAQSTAP